MLKADFVDTILASQYIKPQVEKFSSLIDSATDIDKAYFFSHYQFLVREQWFGNVVLMIEKRGVILPYGA